MATNFLDRCEAIEECYEFMLGYAGQGLPSDRPDGARSQIREFLERSVQQLTGLAESCEESLQQTGMAKRDLQDFVAVLRRDAHESLAAIQMVLAQPSISSQLIDNLNASAHLRALLTDLFLVGDILRTRTNTAISSTAE